MTTEVKKTKTDKSKINGKKRHSAMVICNSANENKKPTKYPTQKKKYKKRGKK